MPSQPCLGQRWWVLTREQVDGLAEYIDAMRVADTNQWPQVRPLRDGGTS